MKKILFTLIIVCAVASISSAQVPGKPFSLYLDAGLNVTTAPQSFKDYHKLGYHAEGGIGFKAFPMIQIVGKLGFYTVAKDWNFIPGLSDILDGGNIKIMTFGFDARASIGAPLVPIKPFGFIGGGWAKVAENDITFSGTGSIGDYYTGMMEDQTKFYYNFGGGLEFGSGPLAFFIQAKYMSIATDGESIKYIPVSFGIKF